MADPVRRAAPRTYRAWTLRDEQRLRDLWAQGLTVPAIGRVLARTPEAVASRRQALGLPRREKRGPWPLWTPADDARLRDLWATGARVAAIAQALGRTEAAVWTRRAVLGLPPHVGGRVATDA